MEVSQKREEGNSRASSSGNKKRRVFVPYSVLPRAPYAPKSSGNNSCQPQSNTGGENYHPPAGSHTGVTCYSCGQPSHYSRECSQRAVGRNDQQAKKNDKSQGAGRGRLTHVTVEEYQEDPRVILGMLRVNSILATVLFDSGASHTFISQEFARENGIPFEEMSSPIEISTPGSRWQTI